MRDVSLRKRIGIEIAIVVVLMALSATMATAVTFQKGDVFAAVGDGKVKHYNSSGTLLEILDTGKGPGIFTTGMALDSSGNLYVTDFNAQNVSKFTNAGLLLGDFGSGYDSSDPESILFDATGNAYVGEADGTRDILKFDPTGTFLNSYSPTTESRGTDWIDLASDQKTMYYTSEGSHIKRFDVSTNTQLSDFATLPSSPCYALRIRPNTGGEVLVACTNNAFLLDNTGAVLQTYPAPAGETWFALNLDPDNKSFWTGDLSSVGKAHKIDIATGTTLMTITTSSDSPISALAGLAVFGELTAAKQKGSISGMKFNDLNGNGVNDAEPGLANWTITLTNESGSVVTTTTNANGNYSFTNLTDGNYTVGEVLQPGWTQTAPQPVPPGTYNVTISGGNEAKGLDFGNKEIPAVEGRMTGGGSVFNASMRVTHSFELNCNASKVPNNLEVNWGKGNKFHLDNLTTASCSDNPAIEPNPPNASFDTYNGTGTGSYNGASGATAEWTFTDAGEPGNNDTAKIIIKDSSGNIVLSVSGNLTRGNHQAHNE